MRIASRLVVALLTFVLLTMGAYAQSSGDETERRIAPTIIGATGLFTVFDASTLQKGQVRVGVFYNNFRRDPGEVHIENIPFNVAVGLGRVEFFANVDFNQTITVRQPQALSGFLLPQSVDPTANNRVFFQVLTPGHVGPGFFIFHGFPFVQGALVGGILPGLPNQGTPIFVNDARFPGTGTVNGLNITGRVGFGPFCNRATDPNCLIRVQPTPPFLFDQDVLGFQGFRPSYLNNYPFLGRTYGNGLGDVTAGGKIRIGTLAGIDFAALGEIRIPTESANLNTSTALLRGRGAGAVDFGGYLIMSSHISHLNVHANFGYLNDGAPKSGGIVLLDRSNEFHAAAGVDLPFAKYFQFIGEFSSETYVGHHTSDAFQKNPLEARAGLRIFPFSFMSIGGSYQALLNPLKSATFAQPFVDVNNTASVFSVNRTIGATEPSGFIAYVAFGPNRTTRPAPPAPPAPNQPPVVNCSATPTSFTQGQGGTVTVSAVVRDPENDLVTYTWNASGGANFTGSTTGPTVTLDTASLQAGSYTITVAVDDKHNPPVTCSSTFTIVAPPPPPAPPCPTISSLTVDPVSVTQGDNTKITATVNASGGNGSPLNYQWSVSQGSVTGSGSTVTIDTTGMSAGTVTVRVTATDGNCPVSQSASFTINAPPPVPVAERVADCSPANNESYKRNNVVRTDNTCKGFLDSAANRLQADPRATLVIDGFADPKERANAAQQRAENARDYLVSKGIDASRIRVRSFGSTRATGDPNDNRKIVIYFVPAGAQEPQ